MSLLLTPSPTADHGQKLADGVKLLKRWTILESDEDLTFPFLSPFDDGRVLLQATKGVHCTRAEQTIHMISADQGRTWQPVAMPLAFDSLLQWGLMTFQGDSKIYTYEQRWQMRSRPMIGYRWERGVDGPWKSQKQVEADGDSYIAPRPWSDAQEVRYELPDDYAGYNLHLPPLILGNRWLALIHGSKRHAPSTSEQRELQYSNVLAIESTDTGRSWRVCGRVSDFQSPPSDSRIGFEGPCEPAGVHLGDGRILVVMRTGNINIDPPGRPGLMHRTISRDGGRTWSPLQSLGIPGTRPEFRQLSDGRIFLICGRPGNLLIPVDPQTGDLGDISDVFRGDPALFFESCCNPSCVEVSPGRLLYVYSHTKLCNGGVTGNNPNRLMAALLQV
jgi:hypothetical protein